MNRHPVPGSHSLPEPAAVRLDPALVRGGLIVGQEGREPLVLRLFRARPTRIGLFASGYVAALLGYRALAMGARVVVVTARQPSWSALVRAAPVGPAWVNLVPPDSPVPPAGTMLRPVLVIDDVGPVAKPRREAGPWQAVVTLRPYLTPQAVDPLRGHDLLVMQRMAAEAVGPVRAAFGLPADAAQWLPRMPDGTVALAERGRLRFVNLTPTQVEQMAFGPPTRDE
ncbi:MAG TPA: hypothetical protein VFX70_12905 [Mycobacteriales bacterium]|nr:hypothetical protein [Mycobacteriales bacterium]